MGVLSLVEPTKLTRRTSVREGYQTLPHRYWYPTFTCTSSWQTPLWPHCPAQITPLRPLQHEYRMLENILPPTLMDQMARSAGSASIWMLIDCLGLIAAVQYPLLLSSLLSIIYPTSSPIPSPEVFGDGIADLIDAVFDATLYTPPNARTDINLVRSSTLRHGTNK